MMDTMVEDAAEATTVPGHRHRCRTSAASASRASACATDVDGCTPLHNAAEAGHDTVCALLLEAGASASAIARHGQAAFHLAAERGHTSTARLLLDAVGDDDAAAQQRFAQLRAAPVARPDALQWRSYSVVPPGSTVAAAQKAPSQAPHAGAVAARARFLAIFGPAEAARARSRSGPGAGAFLFFSQGFGTQGRPDASPPAATVSLLSSALSASTRTG